jgi:hypothetical protein
MFQIIGAMAEFERALIRERVRAGIRNAKAKGKRIGRPRGLRGRHKDCLSTRSGSLLVADRGRAWGRERNCTTSACRLAQKRNAGILIHATGNSSLISRLIVPHPYYFERGGSCPGVRIYAENSSPLGARDGSRCKLHHQSNLLSPGTASKCRSRLTIGRELLAAQRCNPNVIRGNRCSGLP